MITLSLEDDPGVTGLVFVPVGLQFKPQATSSAVFAAKCNRTLAETVRHRRYAHLAKEVFQSYAPYLSWPLGKALLHLKSEGDEFYRRFLNDHGEEPFCRFRVADAWCLNKRGVYLYAVGNQLSYIGRCLDSFRQRIDNGYGRISPKNC